MMPAAAVAATSRSSAIDNICLSYLLNPWAQGSDSESESSDTAGTGGFEVEAMPVDVRMAWVATLWS